MISFIYSMAIIVAFFIGFALPKNSNRKVKSKKPEELLSIKEIKNFLRYNGDEQE